MRNAGGPSQTRWCVGVFVVCFGALGAPVWAKRQAPPPNAASGTGSGSASGQSPTSGQLDEVVLERAKAVVEKAKAAYQAGDYDAAAKGFREANRLRPSPILWFNIGLAEDKRGDCGQALRAYRRYLQEIPDANNRVETEENIADLIDRQQKGTCRKREARSGRKESTPLALPGSIATPGAAPTGAGSQRDEATKNSPAKRVPLAPPVAVATEPTADEPAGPLPGMWPNALSIRFGALVGGFGDVPCAGSAGVRLRAAYTTAIAQRADGQHWLSLEPFLSVSHFGYRSGCLLQDPVLGLTVGTNLTGSFSAFATGVAARGRISLSDRHRLSLEPALGFGVAPVVAKLAFDHTDQVGRCEASSWMILPFVNLDVQLRYELGTRSAITFSPMSLYIFLPSLNDGSAPFACRNDLTGAKQVYRMEGTTVSYGFDIGYAFQF